MSADIEIQINASKLDPKIVQVNARIIAKIIMRKTGAREIASAEAANMILDYLASCLARAASIM